MMTYIIKSQGYYKIGKTADLGARLRVFNTHCFEFKLVKLIYADIEALLHMKFAKKRIKLEWFKLTKTDLKTIDKIILKIGDIESSDYEDSWSPKDTIQGKQIITRASRRIMESEAQTKVSNRNKKIAQINENGDILKIFESSHEAAESIGKTAATIRNSCLNKAPTIQGYRFAYV